LAYQGKEDRRIDNLERAMRILLASVLIAATCACFAQAQALRAGSDPNSKAIRINANFQIATPVNAPASASDLTKALAQANQSLYDIINHQCEVIGAALKGDCRIVQLNVNGNAAPSAGPQQIVSANANATFLIEPAAAKDAPASKDAPAQQ
jgi:hypothetical protein